MSLQFTVSCPYCDDAVLSIEPDKNKPRTTQGYCACGAHFEVNAVDDCTITVVWEDAIEDTYQRRVRPVKSGLSTH